MHIGNSLSEFGVLPQVPEPSQESVSHPKLLALSDIVAVPSDTLISGEGLVVRASIKRDRSGQPYLSLTLRCADGGTVEGRWWRFPYGEDRCPHDGTVYWVSGRLELFNGEPQLRLHDVRPVLDADLTLFARMARRPLSDLEGELDALIAALDTELAALVRAVLAGEVYQRFCTWPAAQSHHGAVRHGLLAHSVRVARLAEHIGAAYGPDAFSCDWGLVIAASLLHDVGKVSTLPPIAGGPLPEEARQVDHVTRGVLMVREAAARTEPCLSPERLARLVHAILAHHGMRDWGAPVEPQSTEAWLVHLADLAEARLWAWSGEG